MEWKHEKTNKLYIFIARSGKFSPISKKFSTRYETLLSRQQKTPQVTESKWGSYVDKGEERRGQSGCGRKKAPLHRSGNPERSTIHIRWNYSTQGKLARTVGFYKYLLKICMWGSLKYSANFHTLNLCCFNTREMRFAAVLMQQAEFLEHV